MNLRRVQPNLLKWYRENKRELPWRFDRDPYRIWISETMLQQTTTTAVIPFFERFLTRFPTLKSLAEAPLSAVNESWAGLGYYSRARNLHKAAIALNEMPSFPRTHRDLIELPGFGPYTSRSVASLAFGESVGVVDGNVIRVLARAEGHDWDWWSPKVRNEIQSRADAWVQGVASDEMNQALMELGRTVCTPKSPFCNLCPLHRDCLSLKQEKVATRPKAKPRRAREVWLWEPVLSIKKGRVFICKNDSAPFLRGQWLLPGLAKKVQSKPKKFDYQHSITHHDIFVTVKTMDRKFQKSDLWVPLDELRQYIPASLVQKALAFTGHTSSLDGLPTRTNRRTSSRK